MAEVERYGIILGDTQYLTEQQIAEIVNHIMGIKSIWTRLSRIRADQWIDEDLGKAIRIEIDSYAKQRQWRVGAPDLHGKGLSLHTAPSIISLLRKEVAEVQGKQE